MIIMFPVSSTGTQPQTENDLGPIKKFRLESLLEQPPDDNLYLTLEIERLILAKKYGTAYDLYMSDGIDDPPDDYDVFLSKQIDCDGDKLESC